MATGKSSGGAEAIEAGGFMLYHLIISAVLGILVGAYVKTKFMSAPEEVAKVEL